MGGVHCVVGGHAQAAQKRIKELELQETDQPQHSAAAPHVPQIPQFPQKSHFATALFPFPSEEGQGNKDLTIAALRDTNVQMQATANQESRESNWRCFLKKHQSQVFSVRRQRQPLFACEAELDRRCEDLAAARRKAAEELRPLPF